MFPAGRLIVGNGPQRHANIGQRELAALQCRDTSLRVRQTGLHKCAHMKECRARSQLSVDAGCNLLGDGFMRTRLKPRGLGPTDHTRLIGLRGAGDFRTYYFGADALAGPLAVDVYLP